MVSKAGADVVVAGHICLDIIPELPPVAGSPVPEPGKLRIIGGAVVSTGGAVSNTGMALHRLGVSTSLMGKVGNDVFGHAILDVIRREDEALANGMIVTDGETSSYTLVFNPPGVDRCFLHCRGANDTFSAEDIDFDRVAGSKLFHFGYPPLIRSMFVDDGKELAHTMHRMKELGLTTSLDMAEPDPDSEAGRADWNAILRRVLPHVDLFFPSVEEILFMLDKPRYQKFRDSGGALDTKLLNDLAEQLLSLGVKVACLKHGACGIYLRTTADLGRLHQMGTTTPRTPEDWVNRELMAPCFQVDVVGTTGSGDCTIAGFLAAWVRGMAPEAAITRAVAVGACNVEAADATSGVRSWEATEARINAGWPRHPLTLPADWSWQSEPGVYLGPKDKRRSG